MSSELFFVVMAGGSGTRFWPRGREGFPKQLLAIGPEKTLIQETMARIPEGVPSSHILVVTNRRHADAIRSQVDIPQENILEEPQGRNTAPCIGLAACVLEHRSPGAVMVVLAADHIISPAASFEACLSRAVEAAEADDVLVSLGIKPTYPSTGFGYIEPGEDVGVEGVRDVVSFREKPDQVLAEELVGAGCLWNCGIFAWKASVILAEIARHMPDLRTSLVELEDVIDTEDFSSHLERIYEALPATSIDHGVLEVAENRRVVEADFAWDDVGTLEAIARHNDSDDDGNVVIGQVISMDSQDCIVDNRSDGVVATLGLENIIVVRTDDAVLVARRDRAEDVKALVEELRRRGDDRYL